MKLKIEKWHGGDIKLKATRVIFRGDFCWGILFNKDEKTLSTCREIHREEILKNTGTSLEGFRKDMVFLLPEKINKIP